MNKTKELKRIVEECARIADAKRPQDAGCGYITKTIGQRIKEHFEHKNTQNNN